MENKYIERLNECKSCGSGDLSWCNISIRPYCNECGNWGAVNLGTAEDAIEDWNRTETSISKIDELKEENEQLKKENEQLKIQLESYVKQSVGNSKIIDDLKTISEEIYGEISSRPQDRNIGKIGCLSRINLVIYKHEKSVEE